jgi:hypothetical protein
MSGKMNSWNESSIFCFKLQPSSQISLDGIEAVKSYKFTIIHKNGLLGPFWPVFTPIIVQVPFCRRQIREEMWVAYHGDLTLIFLCFIRVTQFLLPAVLLNILQSVACPLMHVLNWLYTGGEDLRDHLQGTFMSRKLCLLDKILCLSV